MPYKNVKRVNRVKTISFVFLTYHLYKDARFQRNIDSQWGNAIHKTRGREGESALNMSGIIDSQLHNKFNRLQTLITLLFMDTVSNSSESHIMYTMCLNKLTNVQHPKITIVVMGSTKMIILHPTGEG